MLEFTGMASLLRGVSILYWLVAVSALTLVIWKTKHWWGKTLGAAVVVAVFGYLPVTEWLDAKEKEAYARDAWAYFKKKCDGESGERIHKTFTGVNSVLVMKPLPPASDNDLHNRYWYGDPYSDATPSPERAKHAASALASPLLPVSLGKQGRGFDFVESTGIDGGKLVKYYYEYKYNEKLGRGEYWPAQQEVDRPASRFGISWEDISTPEDRKYWVAGSRLRIIDRTDKTVVAERIGFLIEPGFGSKAGLRSPWLMAHLWKDASCPQVHSHSDRWFILKVLRPPEEKQHGK